MGCQSQVIEFGLHQILDRLHIVIGRFLDLLNAKRIGFGEVTIQIPELFERSFVDIGQLGQRQLTQRNKILHLDHDPITNQCKLGKIVGQNFALPAVTAVDGRYGCKL